MSAANHSFLVIEITSGATIEMKQQQVPDVDKLSTLSYLSKRPRKDFASWMGSHYLLLYFGRICLPLRVTVCLSVFQSVCLSVSLSVCLSFSLSVCLSFRLIYCLSVCLSV